MAYSSLAGISWLLARAFTFTRIIARISHFGWIKNDALPNEPVPESVKDPLPDWRCVSRPIEVCSQVVMEWIRWPGRASIFRGMNSLNYPVIVPRFCNSALRNASNKKIIAPAHFAVSILSVRMVHAHRSFDFVVKPD